MNNKIRAKYIVEDADGSRMLKSQVVSLDPTHALAVIYMAEHSNLLKELPMPQIYVPEVIITDSKPELAMMVFDHPPTPDELDAELGAAAFTYFALKGNAK